MHTVCPFCRTRKSMRRKDGRCDTCRRNIQEDKMTEEELARVIAEQSAKLPKWWEADTLKEYQFNYPKARGPKPPVKLMRDRKGVVK